MMSNETIRQQTLENNNNLKDAIALLRVWLRQRNLDSVRFYQIRYGTVPLKLTFTDVVL